MKKGGRFYVWTTFLGLISYTIVFISNIISIGGKKMRKIVPLAIIGIVVLSGLHAAALSPYVAMTTPAHRTDASTSVRFPSPPTLSEKDGFLEIHLDGATSFLLESTRPVLPVYVKTFQIPFGSTNIQVTCTEQDIHTLPLTREILPAWIAPLSTVIEQPVYEKDPMVYGSTAFYPASWSSYDLGAGRNKQEEQVTFVKVVCYPVRYSPLTNTLEYTNGFTIQLTYDPPSSPLQSAAEDYDLVIIAPEKFSAALQSLVEFKNGKGVQTKFKSVEAILDEYDGYDPPEKIKYFIKNEYDTAHITYVLFVGGIKSHLYSKDKDTRSGGWTGWWVPVRYVNMPHSEDPGCLSDFYYGCLYNATGVFDSWDSNGDGVYAAWNAPGASKDTFDLYPEVYVSRLPVANTFEVRNMVKKIISYESTGPSAKPWYKNFIGVAGKTFYMWQGQPDGEYLCDLAFEYTQNVVPGLTLTSCYATNRDSRGRTPVPKDILQSFNEGAGFIDFEGHGNPYSWNTIWHDGVYPDDWTGGFNLKQYPFLFNGKKLPVVVVGGCHNGLYNVSMIAGLMENTTHHPHFEFGYPIPVCFSAGLVLKARGGAIASTGCTGYGLGSGSGDPATILSGALESNFFYEIGEGATHFAQAHGQAIVKYLNEHTIAQSDAYCITHWALFGDPSLLFGGYAS
jgi:hypothetical protein